jgi:mannonate dehydratase
VSIAAALHFDPAVNNFGIQEYMRHTREMDEFFPHGYYFKDGCLHPGEGPGLCGDYDEALAKRFPYERAYLPVNRENW